MLNFKNTEIEDFEVFKKYINSSYEQTCENAFVNQLVWQKMYHNMWAEQDGIFVMKSGEGEETTYSLPFGGELIKGIKLIKEHSGNKSPMFWAQDGERLAEFYKLYRKGYDFIPMRDDFDYIYLRKNLAELSGKRYHSKRNHISAFSKKYAWQYRPITEENIGEVADCLDTWYAENADRMDEYMLTEQRGIMNILNNMEYFGVSGGAIYVDGRVVAFTLGAPLNHDTFDVLFEKALSEFAECYTVINCEFAKRLEGYKYLNREDDMGIEGLRRAKLSYKPTILLKKYLVREKR